MTVALLALASAGCTANGAPTAAEVCDQAVELGCVSPSADRVACIAGQEEQLEINRGWGCDAEWVRYSTCLYANNDTDCNPGPSCNGEVGAVTDCIVRAMTMM